MKYEDYEQKLTELVKSNPDSAVAVQDILDNIKADSETFAALEASVTEKDSKIKDLQDSNIKLFLRQTGAGANQEPEEEKPKTFEEKLLEIDNESKGEK